MSKAKTYLLKTLHILWLMFLGIVVLTCTALILLQNPKVQTSVSSYVVDKVFAKIDGDVSYDKIHFKPFSTIVIKNLLIKDKRPYIPPPEVMEKLENRASPQDTLMAAEYLVVQLSPLSLLNRLSPSLTIRRVQVKNGIFCLVIEDGRTSLERMLSLPKERTISYNTPPSGGGLPIRIEKVELDHFAYAMLNFKRSASHFHNPGSVDWADMRCTDISARGRNLQIKDGVVSGEMRSCSFREKCGIEVSQVSARFDVREGLVNIEDIVIKDRYSDTRVPFFRMIYDGAEAFTDYVGKVRMYSRLDNTVIDTRTLDYFSDITGEEGMKLKASGCFDGTVSDFRLKDLRVEEVGGDFSARIDGRAIGLPFVENVRFDVRIDRLSSDDRAIEKFVRVFAREKLDLPEFRIKRMDASFKGKPNDIGLQLDLHSDIGNAALKGRLSRLVEKKTNGDISLNLSAEAVRLDRLSGSDALGKMHLETALQASLDKQDILRSRVDIDSLVISQIGLLGYDYRNIDIRGEIADRNFNGTASIDDENLKAYFDGLATLLAADDTSRYRFRAGISYADLQTLGFDRRGRSRIRTDWAADFSINEKKELSGRLELENNILENNDGIYNLGGISVRAGAEGSRQHLRIDSEMLQAGFSGSRSLLHFIGRSVGEVIGTDPTPWDGSRYQIELTTGNMEKLLAFLSPGMYVEPGSAISADINEAGTLDGKLDCKLLKFGENAFNDIRVGLANPSGRLDGNVLCREIELGQFRVDDISLNLWGDLSDPKATRAGFYESSFRAGQKKWDIAPCRVELEGKKGVHIDHFALTHQHEGIYADGRVGPEDMSDSLTIRMNRFDLGLISGFMSKDIPPFGGNISGEALLSRRNRLYGADADIICDSTHFDNKAIGTLLLTSEWDRELKRYSIQMDNSYNEAPTFELGASYSPYTDDFFLSGDFQRFGLGFAGAMVRDIFHQVDGQLSGLVTAEGNFKDPSRLHLSSHDLRIENGLLGIAYTKVSYHVSSLLNLSNDGIFLSEARLTDKAGAKGSVSGGIRWNRFRDIAADLHIRTDKMELLDIQEKDKDFYSFYGHISGSGTLDITGPFDALLIDVKASTSGVSSDFNLAMDSASQSSSNGTLLTFTRPEMPGTRKEVRMQAQPQSAGDLTVKLQLDVTKDVTARIDIDKFNGSRITAVGEGNIIVDVRPSKDLFKLNGNYAISEGKVRFVALGLTARDFTISNGSNIAFGGDVMESTLDIDAIYKTKASLSSLISDSTAVNRRPVECGIKVTDKLRNPHVAFSINIPDLDPTSKTAVESAFSTEDKVQRQFLALLVAGTFIPDEQSGIQNNTSTLSKNLSDVMMTQINNIFMKLDIPLDLGFNYQPTTAGTSAFDVAISTQLFNNRVLVNGNIGNKQRLTSGGNRNEIVGDLDIEVKINKPGTLRFTAFSHSADQYTNYLDNLQRTGVGISWQQEFNHFGHYVRHLFSGKKQRSVLEQLEERQLRSAGTKRITIEE